MLIKRTAIILCGGKDSNVYKNRDFLKIEYERSLDIILDKLVGFDEIIISCSDKKLFDKYNGIAKVVEDDIEGIGPISGIYKSLNESKNNKSLVISIDMPLIREEYIKKLAKYEFDEDAMVTFADGSSQPFCGVYDKRIIKIIRSLIERKKYPVKELLKFINVRYVFPKEYSFYKCKEFGKIY